MNNKDSINSHKILAILPVSIGGRLTTSSIIDGFRQNKYDVDVYDELFDKEFMPDKNYTCMVGYDYSCIKLKEKHNLSLPSINYFSDCIRTKAGDPEWEEYEHYLSDKDNYIFYWDRELTKEEQLKNIKYLPHFVNFDIYKDLGCNPEFDIIFTGRLDTDYRLNFVEQLATKLPDLKFGWFAIERHYKDAKKRSKYPELINKIYQKFIDNEEEMAKVINNTRIVFNMHSQGKSCLNYRTFQTIACKRLIISDFREELDLFDNNVPYYNDVDDLVLKIQYFLNNPNQYKHIVENCYKIAYKNHNSKDCIKQIIEATGI